MTTMIDRDTWSTPDVPGGKSISMFGWGAI
jgi:hypothetical protein